MLPHSKVITKDNRLSEPVYCLLKLLGTTVPPHGCRGGKIRGHKRISIHIAGVQSASLAGQAIPVIITARTYIPRAIICKSHRRSDPCNLVHISTRDNMIPSKSTQSLSLMLGLSEIKL